MLQEERKSLKVQPIGIIHSPFTEANGTPIQSTLAEGAEGWVDIFSDFTEGLADL